MNEVLSEKMMVNRVSSEEYAKLVTKAYEDAPKYDPNAVKYWNALNSSNHKLFKRLLSKINVVFTTAGDTKGGSIIIDGKKYKVINHGDPYDSQSQMKRDVEENNRIMIMIDHSDHPVFSVEDNIKFRTVHDYIVHILGNKPFGLFGELQSYNLHVKMAPVNARPALFTEVVGQVSYAHVKGDFPEQKVAVLEGFDYVNVGNVEQYIIDKYS